MVDEHDLSASEKINNIRQKADFDAKLAQRNFAMQHTELAHSYDKRLEDQKNMYEDTIADLKDQMIKGNRDSEHRTKLLLDEQQHGYDQKVATMEFQNKDRERTIAQSYQDEIDKLKRVNALLSQRKPEKS
jgi:hypothetical protein